MAAEIELKLTLPQQPHNGLENHPLVQRYQRSAPQQQALYNRYFDTPEQTLNQHAIALRIRRQGQAYIQTLKTRGSSQGGLHQRQEWEWPLPTEELNPALLPSDAFPQDVETAQLQPAFSTDFQRTTWVLDYRSGELQAVIELVLDEGWVSDGSRRDPLHEIELELKRGDAGALISFARELATSLPLRICRISKAERGYRLSAPERARQLPPLPTFAADTTVEAAFYSLLDALLERIQSAIEGYEFLADDALLIPLADDFDQLLTLMDCFAESAGATGLIAPLSERQRELRRLLAPLLLKQRTGTPVREPQHARLDVELREWLNQLTLGQLLLEFSSLLQRRPWNAAAEPFIDTGP